MNQDFGSYVVIGRARRDIGRSFVGLLLTDRETRDGRGGYNRVAGPDFQWRPVSTEVVTGQFLFSATGGAESLASYASDLQWSHDTTRLDLNARYKDLGDEFRADTGFVPQVGYREGSGGGGWTLRPTGFVRRLRAYVDTQRQVDREGVLISRHVTPGVDMDVRWSGFLRLRWVDERTRSGAGALDRRQVAYVVRFSPSSRIAEIRAEGNVGEDIDFANSRPARGGTINVSARLNLTQHLELHLLQNERRLNVDALDTGTPERLFTARVSRVRGTYTFTARSFARVIAQYVSTTRNPLLYLDEASRRSASFSGSLLFAYKLNWQSVLFVGYGDERALSDGNGNGLEPAGRQAFVKVSYAFQR